MALTADAPSLPKTKPPSAFINSSSRRLLPLPRQDHAPNARSTATRPLLAELKGMISGREIRGATEDGPMPVKRGLAGQQDVNPPSLCGNQHNTCAIRRRPAGGQPPTFLHTFVPNLFNTAPIPLPRIDTMCPLAHTCAMSPKQRFPVMLEPAQVAALREIEARTGARISEQIRRAIDDWVAKQGDKETGRRRAQTRRRP